MIGILGGTFDPVHKGHVQIALDVHHALGLEQTRLIPCNVPTHRDMPVASAEQRCAMLELAIEGHPELSIDMRELERAGPSWMVDTLSSLRQELGKTPLCLIVGVDAFNHINTWHEWHRLIELAHIVVVKRPEFELAKSGTVHEFYKEHMTQDKQALSEQPAGLVYQYEATRMDISSTGIRERIRAGEDAGKFLCPKVWSYIQKHAIY